MLNVEDCIRKLDIRNGDLIVIRAADLGDMAHESITQFKAILEKHNHWNPVLVLGEGMSVQTLTEVELNAIGFTRKASKRERGIDDVGAMESE